MVFPMSENFLIVADVYIRLLLQNAVNQGNKTPSIPFLQIKYEYVMSVEF